MNTKTLKDLIDNDQGVRDYIKAEAIKWIKELEKNKCMYHHPYPEDREDCNKCIKEEKSKSQIEWIKHFFNISEEDLK